MNAAARTDGCWPFAFARLTPGLGAEVRDLDVTVLDDAAFGALLDAWRSAGGVLVVRGQSLAPAQQLAFSRRFGPLFGEAEALQETVSRYLHPDHPGIFRVSNKVRDGEPQGRSRAGTYWHSDVSFRARPAMASLLHAIELPPCGGDTLFASLHAAYESLTPAMQRLLEPLEAVHDFAVASQQGWGHERKVDCDLDGSNRSAHPVVITHPESGRRALFVNPGFTSHIDGLSQAESRTLLEFLYARITRPEFTYRHRWHAGDLFIWDNRSVLHHAIADYEGRGERYMHRTTVIAQPPRR